MHGFKPKKAHAAAAQNFADGGMVGRIKGALGFKPEDPEREKRLADYRAARELEKQQAKAAAAQPAPAAPQPQKAISSYAAGSALEERMRKAGAYAGGGMVRGKGTGTSDEVPAVVPEGTYIMPADSTKALGAKGLASMGAPGVPVNLSNGEFKMPPEQVHAVGVQALDQMKGATHTPVQPQQATAPGQPPEPELFFANGGVVTEEERQRRLAMQPAPYGLAPAGPGDASRLARVPAGIGGNQPNAAPPAAAPPVARPPAMVSPMAAMPVASKNPGLFPGNSPDAGANVYGGAGMALGTSGLLATGAERVIAAQPPRPQAPVVQPRPAPPTGAQIDGMVNQIPRDVGPRPAMQQAVQMPQQAAPAAPARAGWQNDLASLQQQNVSPAPAAPAPAIPATQVEGWRTKAVMDGAAQDAQAAWDRGGAEGVAGAAGAVARGAITAIPTAVGEFAYNTVAPLGGVAKGFWNGLTGGADQSAPAQAAAGVRGLGVPAAAAASPAPVASAGRPQAVAAPTQPGQQPLPPQAPAQPPAAGPTEIMPGVFRQGNSYADSVAGLSGANTGRPNAQNMAAAQALSDRSERESMGRIMAQQRQAQMVPGGGPVEAGSFTGGYSGVIGGGSGNMRSRTPEQQRRDAAVSASSIDPRTSARGTAALKSLDVMDLQSSQSDSAMEQARLREGGANNRAFMQQQGESQRSDARNQIDGQRLQIEGQRVQNEKGRYDLEGRAKGFDIRQAERMEGLQNEYLAAQNDPKKAESVLKKIQALSGKTSDPAARYTAVSGGQEWDAQAGAMRNVPGRVLNNQTGQWVQDGPAAVQAPIGQNPKALAIKNDTKMTTEQKRAALAQLGY